MFCTRNPAEMSERASALDPGHIIPSEENHGQKEMRISALLVIHRQVLLGSTLPAVFLLELVCLPHLSRASFGFFGTGTTGPRDPSQTQHNINSLLFLFKCRCVQVLQANWGHRLGEG